MLTTLGPVELEEVVWRQQRGRTLRPFCAAVGVNARGQSARLTRALVDFGADHAFAVAAQKMREHYGVEIAPGRVRRMCLQTAARIERPGAVGALPARGPEWIVAETDGTMLPVVDTAHAPPGSDRRKHRRVYWLEGRLAAARAHRSVSTAYGYSRGDVLGAGAAWAQAVADSGWGLNSRIHAVGDGAPWIAEQAKVQFGPRGGYLLDLYHVCDYLAAAAPEPNAPQAYLAHAKTRLLAGQAPAVIAELASRREAEALDDAHAPIRCAHRYLANRRDQLDYPSALQHDLPVGSGLIEGSHRHVLQARLKKPGAWWLPAHADAIAALRVLRANGSWLDLWSN